MYRGKREWANIRVEDSPQEQGDKDGTDKDNDSASGGSFHPGSKIDRHEQGSPPSSDDGYSNYDAQKIEVDLEGEVLQTGRSG